MKLKIIMEVEPNDSNVVEAMQIHMDDFRDNVVRPALDADGGAGEKPVCFQYELACGQAPAEKKKGSW